MQCENDQMQCNVIFIQIETAMQWHLHRASFIQSHAILKNTAKLNEMFT